MSSKIKQGQAAVRHPFKNARKALAHQRPDGVIGEWELLPKSEWNRDQRIAAKTLGIVALANIVSVGGALFTADGMNDYYKGNYAKATLKMGVGRALDLLDGLVAKNRGTRSVVGAGIDAGADKLLGASFLIISAAKGDMPAAEALVHASQQARIAYKNFQIRQVGGEPNPSEHGKHGQMALWLRAGGIVLGKALDEHDHPLIATVIEHASEGAEYTSMYLNELAVHDYQNYHAELLSQ